MIVSGKRDDGLGKEDSFGGERIMMYSGIGVARGGTVADLDLKNIYCMSMKRHWVALWAYLKRSDYVMGD